MNVASKGPRETTGMYFTKPQKENNDDDDDDNNNKTEYS